MTDLVERTRGPTVVDETTHTYAPRETPPVPPSIRVPPETSAPSPPPSSWPPAAKAWTVILAVAGLILAVVAIIGFTTGDEPSATEQDLQVQVESITGERDALVAQVTDLQATIDTIAAERDDLQASLATLTTERDDLVATIDATVAERDDLQASLATLTTERDDLVVQVGELDTTVAVLTAERDGLLVDIADLERDLTLQTQRATTAIAAQGALAALFPVDVEMTLGIADVVGTYDLAIEQAYCNGFATCGTMPAVDELTIRETADHRLELVMPGYPTAGLLRLNGVLYAVLDVSNSTTACGTVPRVANVTITVFAQGMTVATDGTQQVTDLAASMTMHAPTTPACDAGTALYALQLTP